METDIYVTLPGGGRALHGTVQGSTFLRRLDRSRVFWRERAFGLNVQVLDRLKKHGVKKLVFLVEYHDKYLQNTVPFDEIESFPVAFVGGGERNYQVPMDKCEVKEILKSPEEVRLSASKFPSKKQNKKDSPPEPLKQLSLL